MEVHMQHGLARCDTILRNRFTPKYWQKKKETKTEQRRMTKGRGTVSCLIRDGELVSLVHVLDDVANAVDGAQVGEARGGAHLAHEYVCSKRSEKVGEHDHSGGGRDQPAARRTYGQER